MSIKNRVTLSGNINSRVNLSENLQNTFLKGVGIADAVLNSDYTLTLLFTDGSSYTTPPIRGAQGEQGIQGETGEAGQDGHSPVITASKAGNVTTVYVDGTAVATISDGADGKDGKDGADGAPGADGKDGKDGKDGADGAPGADGKDGVSPSVTVTAITGGHTIAITDATKTVTFTVLDGIDGQDGANGQDGNRGDGLWKITHSPEVYRDTVDNIEMTARIALSTALADTGLSELHVGEILHYGNWLFYIGAIDSSYVYFNSAVNSQGYQGQAGQDGHSPVVTASKSGKVTTVSVDGTAIATINDGEDGQNGQDGADGTDGQSAYQYAVEGGYQGTEQEFAQKLADEYVTDVQVNGTTVLNNGVANVPIASADNFGAVRIGSGIQVQTGNSLGKIAIYKADEHLIKAGEESYKPIVPQRQHLATFYGLAKAAGADMASSDNAVGTYTDAALKAIRKMLGIPNMKAELINEVTVSQDSTEILINVDSNGQAFKLRKLVAIFDAGASTTGNRDAFYLQVGFVNSENGYNQTTSAPSITYTTATSTMYAKIFLDAIPHMPLSASTVTGTSEGNSQNWSVMPKSVLAESVTSLKVYQSGPTKSLIPSGAKLSVYGIRYDD